MMMNDISFQTGNVILPAVFLWLVSLYTTQARRYFNEFQELNLNKQA